MPLGKTPPGRTLLAASPSLLGRRLHLFTGKGGVGKSTLVVALGLELARMGRRPLIVELGHRASIEGILDVPKVRYEPTEVAPGLFATNMDLRASLVDYVGDHLKVRALGSLALRSQTLRRFFEAAPGVAEVATLHRLRAFLDDAEGFDPILVDLDATGHARMFFELPKVFAEIAESGPLRHLLDRVSAVLRDPALTALHIVTVPGELPVHETIELYRDLHADPAVQLGALIVNMVPARPEGLSVALEAEDASALAGGARAADLALARRALAQQRRAERFLQRLATEVALPQLALPRLPLGRVGEEALRALGEATASGLLGVSEAAE
jgi:anion-transporting  ArsA/GET3 family ATPase